MKILNGFNYFRKKTPSQMFEWVENRLEILSSLLLPAYKLNQKNTWPENMCDIVFEKAKVRGGTVNGTSVYAEATEKRVL